MKTIVSTKGQVVLPADLRREDRIEPGQEFEVERIERGEYRLKRKAPPPNLGLVDLLLECPVKGWFQPMDRGETLEDIKSLSEFQSKSASPIINKGFKPLVPSKIG